MTSVATSVWFLVVPGSELLDIAGPWEVLSHTNDVVGKRVYDLQLRGPTEPEVATLHGLRIAGVRKLPHRTNRPPKVVIVAGGSPLSPMPAPEVQLSNWLRRHAPQVTTVVSICTGAFILGEAGLLDDREVTTHWQLLDDLRSRFQRAKVQEEGIFVRDGRLWTSAGVTAGIDLTLALVERDHGHDVAMTVAKKLLLFLRRSGNQAQFSASLRRQERLGPRERDLTTFVLERIDEPLSVQSLAKGVGMSARSLSRWCRRELGESPGELVRRLRLEEAKRLLVSTSLPLKDISMRSGLGNESTMWRTFVSRLGVTPAEYRQRFLGDLPQR